MDWRTKSWKVVDAVSFFQSLFPLRCKDIPGLLFFHVIVLFNGLCSILIEYRLLDFEFPRFLHTIADVLRLEDGLEPAEGSLTAFESFPCYAQQDWLRSYVPTSTYLESLRRGIDGSLAHWDSVWPEDIEAAREGVVDRPVDQQGITIGIIRESVAQGDG